MDDAWPTSESHWLRMKRRRYLELVSLVPTFEGDLPFIGHLYKVIGGADRLWENLKKICIASEQAGGVILVWAGPKAVFVVNDPDDALTVLNSCLEKSFHYKLAFYWLGNGLVTADVPTWKHNRRLLNSTFSQHVLDGFLTVFNQQAELLAMRLVPMAGGAAFDPTDCFAKAMLETLCPLGATVVTIEMNETFRSQLGTFMAPLHNEPLLATVETAIGISLDDRSVVDDNYGHSLAFALDASAQRLAKFWLYIGFIYRFSNVREKMEQATAVVYNMSRTVLKKRRAERQETKHCNTAPRRFIAFLDLLLDMAEDGSFSDKQILEEVDIFIAAGSDATSRTLLAALVFLGTYKGAQEKVYQEIISVLGSSADILKKDMARLVYTEAVVKETLRLNPPLPAVAREVDRDLKLKNYTIPAGSGCSVVFTGIHRLPMWGPDRLQFRPERWFEPETLPQSPGAFCGFSLGKRNCIGKNYAMMVVKTMLVHLVRKYRVSADYSKVKLKYDLLIRYAEGQHLALELRQ